MCVRSGVCALVCVCVCVCVISRNLKTSRPRPDLACSHRKSNLDSLLRGYLDDDSYLVTQAEVASESTCFNKTADYSRARCSLSMQCILFKRKMYRNTGQQGLSIFAQNALHPDI